MLLVSLVIFIMLTWLTGLLIFAHGSMLCWCSDKLYRVVFEFVNYGTVYSMHMSDGWLWLGKYIIDRIMLTDFVYVLMHLWIDAHYIK